MKSKVCAKFRLGGGRGGLAKMELNFHFETSLEFLDGPLIIHAFLLVRIGKTST